MDTFVNQDTWIEMLSFVYLYSLNQISDYNIIFTFGNIKFIPILFTKKNYLKV